MAMGSWLKSKRELAKLSQKDVANELNYSSAQFVSNWEREQSVPPMDKLPKLAKLLDVTELEIRQQILKVKIAQIEKQWLSI